MNTGDQLTREVADERVTFVFRIALLHYLMIAAAIGPSICCCNSATLFNKVVSFAILKSKDQHANAMQCPYHRALANSTKSQEVPSPSDHCPCHRERSSPALTYFNSSVDVVPQLVAHLIVITVNSAILCNEDLSSGFTGGNFPIVSAYPLGGDILRAYQHFRC